MASSSNIFKSLSLPTSREIAELQQLEPIYSIITLLKPSPSEKLTDGALLAMLDTEQTDSIQLGYLLGELILRIVFDEKIELGSKLSSIAQKQGININVIERLQTECTRIKKRKTKITVKFVNDEKENKEEKEKTGQDDSLHLFDAGEFYTKKTLPPKKGEYTVTYYINHRTLSLFERARVFSEKDRRFAVLEIQPYERAAQERYIIAKQSLPLSSRIGAIFKFSSYFKGKSSLDELRRLAEEHQHPIIVRTDPKEIQSCYIYGPAKRLSNEDAKEVKNWELLRLTLTEQQLLEMYSIKADRIDFYNEKDMETVCRGLYSEMLKNINTCNIDAARKTQQEALETFGEDSVYSELGLSGIVHPETLKEWLSLLRNEKNTYDIPYKYLARSGQLILLDVDDNPANLLQAGLAIRFKKGKFAEFTNRSTLNYKFNTLNTIVEMCYLLHDYTYKNFDVERKCFRSTRECTYSQDKLMRSLDPAHTKETLTAFLELFQENQPDSKGVESLKNDYSSNEDAMRYWNKDMRYNPALIKMYLEHTVYVLCGLEKQEEPGIIWPTWTDSQLLGYLVSIAKKHKIKVDFNAIPDKFKESKQETAKLTPLMLAAYKKDYELMKILLIEGVDIEPVCLAIEKGDLLLREIIMSDVYICARFDSRSRLLNAATYGYTELLRQAIQASKPAIFGEELSTASPGSEFSSYVKKIFSELICNDGTGAKTSKKASLPASDPVKSCLEFLEFAVFNKKIDFVQYFVDLIQGKIPSYVYSNCILASAANLGLDYYAFWLQKLNNINATMHVTHLPAAVCSGDLSLVEKIYENYLQSLSSDTKDMNTIVMAFHTAIRENQPSIVKYFLEKPIFSYSDKSNLVRKSNLLLFAARYGNIELFTQICTLYPDRYPMASENKIFISSLQASFVEAVHKGKVDIINKLKSMLLRDQIKSVINKDYLLLYVVENGMVDVLNHLLPYIKETTSIADKRMDADLMQPFLESALEHKKYDVFEVLLKNTDFSIYYNVKTDGSDESDESDEECENEVESNISLVLRYMLNKKDQAAMAILLKYSKPEHIECFVYILVINNLDNANNFSYLRLLLKSGLDPNILIKGKPLLSYFDKTGSDVESNFSRLLKRYGAKEAEEPSSILRLSTTSK